MEPKEKELKRLYCFPFFLAKYILLRNCINYFIFLILCGFCMLPRYVFAAIWGIL